jgi:predicted ABC-type ATPase
LKDSGYRIHVFFLWLPSVEMALARVRERVLAGGHSVPEEVVRRRFSRGLANLFKLYVPLLDTWLVFENAEELPNLVAFCLGTDRIILNAEVFGKIEREAMK